MAKRDVYMVNVNSGGSVFAKDLEFFRSQGGFEQDWGKHWKPIVADGIQEARRLACDLPGAVPWERQAK